MTHSSFSRTDGTIFSAAWLMLLNSGVVYLFTITRSAIYFYGLCAYISTMVEIVEASLADRSKSIQDQSKKPIDRLDSFEVEALANEIRFHGDILEYVLGLWSPAIFTF